MPYTKLFNFILILSMAGCQQSLEIRADLSLLENHNLARQTGIRCAQSIKQKAPKLTWNTKLAQAALIHSQDMYLQQKLTHTNTRGLSTQARIEEAGYQWRSYGENLVAGVDSNQKAFDLWLNSRQHCKNIVNPVYTEMGAAQLNGYWTAIYASLVISD